MKIAFLCPYSYPSACGVWNSVYNVSKELVKRGYDIYVFSSNIIKGTNKISSDYEVYEGIKIHRFPVMFRIGQGLFFNFIPSLLKRKADIIHTHGYRHPHSNVSVILSKVLGIKCFLTTHAPFVEKNLRNKFINSFVKIYDIFLSKLFLSLFTKVIAISKWEIPYLLKSGCKRENYSNL